MDEQKYPIPTVGAVIVNSDGKILLLKSDKWHGKFVVPGGHIEVGEKMEDAIRREVKEETGLDIHDLEFMMPSDFIFDPIYHKRRHFIFLDFLCKTNDTAVKLNDEAQEFVWATPEEALKMDIEPYTVPLVEKLIKRG